VKAKAQPTRAEVVYFDLQRLQYNQVLYTSSSTAQMKVSCAIAILFSYNCVTTAPLRLKELSSA